MHFDLNHTVPDKLMCRRRGVGHNTDCTAPLIQDDHTLSDDDIPKYVIDDMDVYGPINWAGDVAAGGTC